MSRTWCLNEQKTKNKDEDENIQKMKKLEKETNLKASITPKLYIGNLMLSDVIN